MRFGDISLIKKSPETVESAKVHHVDTFRVDKNWLANYISPRTVGEFADRAFYLSNEFGWAIGKDSAGDLILVPLKRGATSC